MLSRHEPRPDCRQRTVSVLLLDAGGRRGLRRFSRRFARKRTRRSTIGPLPTEKIKVYWLSLGELSRLIEVFKRKT